MRGRSDFNNPYASPLFADNFSGVAPALIVTPEYDYLRQEGEDRLQGKKAVENADERN